MDWTIALAGEADTSYHPIYYSGTVYLRYLPGYTDFDRFATVLEWIYDKPG